MGSGYELLLIRRKVHRLHTVVRTLSTFKRQNEGGCRFSVVRVVRKREGHDIRFIFSEKFHVIDAKTGLPLEEACDILLDRESGCVASEAIQGHCFEKRYIHDTIFK